MESAYRQSNPHSWDALIEWVEAYAEAERRLTPGEATAMAEDLRRARDAQVQFTTNPGEAYRMAHKYRAENNRKYAAQHAGSTGPLHLKEGVVGR